MTRARIPTAYAQRLREIAFFGTEHESDQLTRIADDIDDIAVALRVVLVRNELCAISEIAVRDALQKLEAPCG